jgi:hypothetical protein
MRGDFGTNGKRGMVGDQGIDGIPGKLVNVLGTI